MVGRLGRRGQRQRCSRTDVDIGPGDNRRGFHTPKLYGRNTAGFDDRLERRRIGPEQHSWLKRRAGQEQTGRNGHEQTGTLPLRLRHPRRTNKYLDPK